MLNVRQTRFVAGIADGKTTTQAYIDAGFSPNGAGQGGERLLKQVEIQEAVEEYRERAARVAGLSSAWILNQYMLLAEADPNDLVEVRNSPCCRNCWGIDFKFQWLEADYSTAVMDAILAGNDVPDGGGGFGFDATREANVDCPECHGGRSRVVIHDTRRAKSRLYAGAKQTKEGIEIKMRDQDAALAFLAKYKGMVVERKELSGPDGSPVPLRVAAADLTDDQLAAIIASASVE